MQKLRKLRNYRARLIVTFPRCSARDDAMRRFAFTRCRKGGSVFERGGAALITTKARDLLEIGRTTPSIRLKLERER